MQRIARRIPLLLFCLVTLPVLNFGGCAPAAFAQASPFNLFVFKAQSFTSSGQTGGAIQLNGLTPGASTVGSSYASGTITLTGTVITTVSFQVMGSSDNGATYYALPVFSVANPGALPVTTATATASGLYQVSLAGLTHIKLATTGAFTATSVTFTLTASPNASISRNGGGPCAGCALLPNTGAQAFQGPISSPLLSSLQMLPEILGGSYYLATSFPNSCVVGGTPYTTQFDCAWRTALAATATKNTTVIADPGVSYTTCAGLPMILPGATGSFSVGFTTLGVNAGFNAGGFSPDNVATVKQVCPISTGTLSMPEVSGSPFKTLSVIGVALDANHMAPYAMQILGNNQSSVFRDIQVANGTTGPAVLGVAFDFTNGFTVNATLDNWQIVDNCSVPNGCGGGGAVTVTVTGGVPTGTITNPGNNYDSNTIATLVGYQNGTRNTPCTFMGVTTPTISGGQLTGQGFTSTATGCVAPMYVQFTDERKPPIGLDIENMTDSRISGLDIRTGALAGLYCQSCGSDVFTGVHSWGQGLFGIQNRSFATFVGTDCGETSLACFDNVGTFAKTTAIGTMYNSGSQFHGFSLFRNETSTSTFKIVGVTCQSTQTAEFHTLANVFGVIDTNAEATTVNTLGNSLYAAEYCGSGTGETLNVIPGNTTILGNIMSPGTTSLGPTLNFSLNSTPFVDCIATGFTQPPTISGSILTFPTNGTDNSGSIFCTDFAGRITMQTVPNSGGGASPQTFDMATQFQTGSATWVRLDPTFGSGGRITLNSSNIQAGSAGTNTLLRCTTAGTLPVGALTITASDCGASVSTGLTVQ